ncbi:MAG: CARDB domain-containing protein, partial [Calditrichota bacterium]
VTQVTPVKPDSITLVRLSPATLPTISGGDTASFVYRADVGDTTGAFNINFNITGQDLNDLRTLGPQLSPIPATLVVRQPGTIVIDSVVIAQSTVSIGQSGIIATVYLQNDGEMPVNVNNLALLFNGSFTGFAQIPLGSTNFNLSGGESTTRDFSLTVLENAPESVTVNTRATGTELNLGQSITAFANQTDFLTVQGASELRILSVSSPYDSVSQGQSGITARVRIRNSGGSAALIDTLALRFSRGTYANYDTAFTPAQVVPAGSTFNFDFTNISVGPASALGVASVNARLVARDSVSNDTLLVGNADTTHSWRAVTPGNIQYVSLTPNRVTTNQTAGFAVRVQNSGQANMYLLPTTLLNVDALTIPITDTTLVPGGQTRDINFQPALVSLPAGLYDVSMDYDFLENLASNSRTLDVLDSMRVDNQVDLDTLSTTYPRTLSQNMTLPISINLTNTAGSATAILDSVVIPELGYNLPINASLAGGSNRIDSLQPYIDTSISGVRNLTVNYYWRDANSGITQVTGFALDPITVLTRAQLTVLDITGPPSVFAGQQDVELQVQIQNSGQTTAIIDTLYLTQQIGIYTKTLVTTDTLIPGGATSTFIFSLDISPSTATGTDNFGAVVQGRDSISTNPLSATGNNLHSWIIYQALSAEILSVSSTRTLVSQGQQNIAFTVRVRNNSNQTLTVDTLLLYPRVLPGTNYSYVPPVITSGTISSGQTSQFNFNVNVDPNAVAGPDTIDARLVASSALTMDTIRINSSTVPHGWTVQERPVLSTASLQITPERMSIIPFPPQDYQQMVVQVQNVGNPAAGSARLDSVKIIANDVIITDPTILDIIQLSALPVTLQQGYQVSVNFGIRPGTSPVPGTYNFRSLIYYTDVNSGIVYTDTSITLDVLVVEQQASLSNNFVAPVVNRYETHWGKSGDTLSVLIYNNGQATAHITRSTLEVVTGTAYAQQNIMGTLIGLTLPTDLSGGANLEFRYRLDYPPTPLGQYNDDVQYQVLIDYEDGNSNQPNTLSTYPYSDTVRVLTPPALSFAVNGLLPSRVEPNMTEAFSVDLINSGSTGITLDTVFTQFTILCGSNPSSTLISPLVILPDTTTTLFFDSVLVNLGEGNYITETHVVGTYHDDVFDQTITTGQLQVGGDIQINSLTFLNLPPIPFLRLGQDSIQIRMGIRNFRNDTLQILSPQTFLEFRDGTTGNQISSALFNLRRTDSVIFLPPQTTSFLDFEFDIPTGILALGPYWISGVVQATNGTENFETHTADDAARFIITSGAELNYVANSLQPNIGIPNQTFKFSLDLTNTEAANVQLEAANSSLTIFNNIETLPPINLDNNYGIPGNSSVTVSFSSVSLPADFPTGIYNISLQLHGTLENLDPYDTTLVADSQFTVLRQAELALQNFDIQPASVVRGTEGIPAVIELSNPGESVARLSLLSLQFWDSFNNNVNNQWLLTGSNVTPPILVNPGQTLTIYDTLTVSASATLGQIRAGLNWRYSDTLRSTVNIDSSRLNLDTINVITPGQVYIESTTIAGVSNLPFVNTNQSYTVRTRIRNNGQDNLQDIKIKLFRNNVPIDSNTVSSLAGNDTVTVSFSTQATPTTGILNYRTQIDSVFSSTGT